MKRIESAMQDEGSAEWSLQSSPVKKEIDKLKTSVYTANQPLIQYPKIGMCLIRYDGQTMLKATQRTYTN